MLSVKKNESDKPKNRVIQVYEILHGNSKLLQTYVIDITLISNMTIKISKLNEKPGNSVLIYHFKTFTNICYR
jgi:hypothetical protein